MTTRDIVDTFEEMYGATISATRFQLSLSCYGKDHRMAIQGVR